MKISLVNYATEGYDKKKKKNSFSAKTFGRINEVYSYSPEDIDEKFKSNNKLILSQQKGAGLWLWKPYFFNKVLQEKVIHNDYLFHCDASSFFIKSVKPLVKKMEKESIDIMCFSLPLIEEKWTSPFVLEYFDVSEKVEKSNQILANFLIVKKTNKTIAFAKEWLSLCENVNLLTGSDNTNEENLDFYDNHRFDQSILSLLCKRYEIKPFRDISQYGEFPEMYRHKDGYMKSYYEHSDYKTIIVLIRKSSFLREYLAFKVKQFIKPYFPNTYNKIINK